MSSNHLKTMYIYVAKHIKSLHFMTIVLLLVFSTSIKAAPTPRDGYLSIEYGSSTFKQSGNPNIKSNLSVAFNLGHTYHLHKKPVGNVIWFDIDATWLNMAYSNFKVEHIDWQSTFKCQYHIPYIGLQVGPAISVVPIKDTQVHAYARYSPSVVCLITDKINDNDNLSFAYGSSWNFGLEFNYRAIGVGLDYTFMDTKLPKLEFMSNSMSGEHQASVLQSLKFVLSIKF